MTGHSMPYRIAPLVRTIAISLMAAAACLSAACRTLPVVSPAAVPATPVPAIVPVQLEVRGSPATPRQERNVVQQLKAEGRPNLLNAQLAAMANSGTPLIAGNAVNLLIDGPATFEAMFRAIDAAKKFILLESYIIEDAEIAQRLAERLAQKRREGVAVFVMYDGVGSLATPDTYFSQLRAAGIATCEFNSVAATKPLRLLDINHRDHRKILVVDGQQAFTGGINISSVYSSGSSSLSRRKNVNRVDDGWRDTQINIVGPAAAEFVSLFRDNWHKQDCANGPAPTAEAAPPAGDKVVLVIGSNASNDVANIYKAFIASINAAQESVLITMAYFAPDEQTIQALTAAVARGVKVQLILPGFSDSKTILYAGHSHYTRLLDAGVAIYERNDAFLHAKTAVIDGVWSTVGSTNMDWRSFILNDEVNAVVLGEDFGQIMRSRFESDRAKATPVTAEMWRKRGVRERFMEAFSRLWEYLL